MIYDKRIYTCIHGIENKIPKKYGFMGEPVEDLQCTQCLGKIKNKYFYKIDVSFLYEK